MKLIRTNIVRPRYIRESHTTAVINFRDVRYFYNEVFNVYVRQDIVPIYRSLRKRMSPEKVWNYLLKD